MGCLKVNFSAAPSSRKSTVCAALESILKKNKINADTSKEYARQYIQNYRVPVDLWEQLIIFENQDIRDKSIAKVSEVLLSDTPAVASYIFGKRLLLSKLTAEGRKEPNKAEYKFLEEMHNKALKKLNWFDIIFVFPPSDPVINDGTRTETMDDKIAIYNSIKGFLDVEGVDYYLIDGDVDQKTEACMDVIMQHLYQRN